MRKYLGQSYLYLVLLITFFSSIKGTIESLDKTWQIVPDKYKYASLINGAVAWETHTINNMHRFANFFPIESKDHRGRTIIGCDPAKTDKTMQVNYTLYYRVPGSTSYTDFNVTELINSTDPVKMGKLGATILVSFDQLPDIVKDYKKAYKELINQVESIDKKDTRAVQQAMKTLKTALSNIEKTSNAKIFDQTEQQLFRSKKSPFFSEEKSEMSLYAAFLKYKKAYLELDTWLKPVRACLKLSADSFLKVSPIQFAMMVADALEECNPDNPDALYPKHFLQSQVWLCFIYKTITNLCESDSLKERKAYQAYYAQLAMLLNDDSIVLPSEMDLPPINPQEALKKAKELLPKAAEQLDSFFYCGIKSRLFPGLLTYGDLAFSPIGASDLKISFADCMENALANFMRMLSYSVKQGVHKLETLQNNLNIIIPPIQTSMLNRFIHNIYDHVYWAQLTTNVPYALYLQYIDYDGTTHLSPDGKPFVSLPMADDKTRKVFEDVGYHIVTGSEGICFELRPSVRTILITLSHLLGLNLSKDLAEEFLRKDFLEHFFPIFCKELSLQKCECKDETLGIAIDQIDEEGEKSLKTSFETLVVGLESPDNVLHHDFHTAKKHGEYACDVPVQQGSLSVSLDENSPVSLILLSYFLNPLEEIYPEKDALIQYVAWFSSKLYDPSQAQKVATRLCEDLKHFPHYFINKRYKELVLQLAFSGVTLDAKLTILDDMIKGISFEVFSPLQIKIIEKNAFESLEVSHEDTVIARELSLLASLVRKTNQLDYKKIFAIMESQESNSVVKAELKSLVFAILQKSYGDEDFSRNIKSFLNEKKIQAIIIKALKIQLTSLGRLTRLKREESAIKDLMEGSALFFNAHPEALMLEEGLELVLDMFTSPFIPLSTKQNNVMKLVVLAFKNIRLVNDEHQVSLLGRLSYESMSVNDLISFKEIIEGALKALLTMSSEELNDQKRQYLLIELFVTLTSKYSMEDISYAVEMIKKSSIKSTSEANIILEKIIDETGDAALGTLLTL